MTGASYLHNHNLRASACGYLFRRLMLDNLRFTPGIYHEDEEFTPLLLLKADQLYFTEADAYYYRQREESITHQADEAHTRKRLEDMRNIIYRLQKTSATIPEGERPSGTFFLCLSLQQNSIPTALTEHRSRGRTG